MPRDFGYTALACADADDEIAGPAAWTVAPEPLLRIGAREGDPYYLFDGVATVRLLPDGGVLVADGGRGSDETPWTWSVWWC